MFQSVRLHLVCWDLNQPSVSVKRNMIYFHQVSLGLKELLVLDVRIHLEITPSCGKEYSVCASISCILKCCMLQCCMLCFMQIWRMQRTFNSPGPYSLHDWQYSCFILASVFIASISILPFSANKSPPQLVRVSIRLHIISILLCLGDMVCEQTHEGGGIKGFLVELCVSAEWERLFYSTNRSMLCCYFKC